MSGQTWSKLTKITKRLRFDVEKRIFFFFGITRGILVNLT